MSSEVRNLEPKVLWNHFEDLNLVPRPSKKEERVIRFIVEFGERLGLETIKDECGNVVIRKPATSGMENKKTVVLQSHLDMVHQKNADTVFDFDNDPIQSYIDNGWVKAKGTTLGADNGIGVAAAMSVLSSQDLEHGPIEALFTVDEETGMTGAFNLQPGFLKGEILLNMDTEDEGELCIGCAGGIDTNVSHSYHPEAISGGRTAYELNIRGLKGGHSGCDIHLQRGNSNKIINRMFTAMSRELDLGVVSIDGGSLRNAIPREAFTTITVAAGEEAKLEAMVKDLHSTIQTELGSADPGLDIELKKTDLPESQMSKADRDALIRAIYACPNGIHRMSLEVDGLVETSNNLSRVKVEKGNILIQCLTRSSVDSSKMDLGDMIRACFEQIGANVEQTGSYPGWAPNAESEVLTLMQELHGKVYGFEPVVNAIHAGLECGIIGKSHPDLDMISFGPTIKNPHSPGEMVDIGTVERFWNYLREALKNIPNN